ncbi:MAG TPA: 1-acyl-sn-glycerol-3-phosphate acyltransferase [Thermoanaerobaculaceae bacterium]|nr:1-acyl-sn-glycerol-3-phosphate acyltransferase [Thermoanaerobaculaceae bacterium]
MGEPYPVAAPDYFDRRNVFFWTAKNIALLGHRFLARPHVEIDEAIPALKRLPEAVFLYCGLHKSLWETSGVLPPLHLAGIPLPYVGMGDNLVHGRLFRHLSKKIGTFSIRRPCNRREMLESARKLRDDVLSFLAYGLDVLVYPEGTRKNIPSQARYGDFFPAAFDAALEYERHRNAILAANPALAPRKVYVVPFNVDYSRVREAEEMVRKESVKPRTLHVFDSFSMIRHIGDTYISFGRPIRVADHLDLDRKGLAALARQQCLDLVKILPVNVASRAILELEPSPDVPPPVLHAAMDRIVEALRPYADRFRGFRPGDARAAIVRRARQVHLDFRRLGPENIALYRLYANYISHYLDPALAT